jgi:hypothetical protein
MSANFLGRPEPAEEEVNARALVSQPIVPSLVADFLKTVARKGSTCPFERGTDGFLRTRANRSFRRGDARTDRVAGCGPPSGTYGISVIQATLFAAVG